MDLIKPFGDSKYRPPPPPPLISCFLVIGSLYHPRHLPCTFVSSFMYVLFFFGDHPYPFANFLKCFVCMVDIQAPLLSLLFSRTPPPPFHMLFPPPVDPWNHFSCFFFYYSFDPVNCPLGSFPWFLHGLLVYPLFDTFGTIFLVVFAAFIYPTLC